MNLPANVEIIQDNGATSSNLASVNAAFDDPGTDYAKTSAEIFLNTGAWEDPLTMADMLICIINATGLDKVPNGTYKSMVDMSQCDDAEGGSQEAKVTRFADATSVNSRAGNTSNQLSTSYFLDGRDEDSDGVISEAENQKFIAKISMSESATTTNPFGVFDFNYNRVDAVSDGAAGDYNRGSMSFINNSTTEIGFSFIEQYKETGNGEYIQWAKGVGAKNGDSGKVYVNTNESGAEVIYRVNFNSTHANIKSGGSSVCSSLNEDLMTTFVYSYNLYNETTGALIDIVAGVEIVYGTEKDKRGYVGSYWDEGASALKLWMHTEDGSNPATIYRKSDTGVAITVNSWSGRTPTISAMTFVAPIQFTDSFSAAAPDSDSAQTRTNDLVYEGPGQLWGIPWTQSSGEWSPSYNLADGDVLIGRNGAYAGIRYKVKRTGAWKTLATVSASNCSSISVADSEFTAFTTAPTLTAISETWASKPAVSAAAKIIHGVKQF